VLEEHAGATLDRLQSFQRDVLLIAQTETDQVQHDDSGDSSSREQRAEADGGAKKAAEAI
jgi:hypothetical protein